MQREAGKRPLLSIVCPAYQEEQVLPLFHVELSAVLAQLENDFAVEVIYVDDGSTDRSLEVIRELAARDEHVRYLSLSRNFGHQAALTAGLEESRGDIVVTLDADLQHPPALLPEMLQKWRAGAEIVVTIREDDVRVGFFKRLTSRWFYRAMHALSDTDVRMAAADYRLMSRKAVDALLGLRETHRFLRGMVQWLGFPVAEIRFRPDNRRAGVSKYTFAKMLNLALAGILSFSKVPLRLALLLGLLSVGSSFFMAVWAIAGWCGNGSGATVAFALVLTSVHLVGGSILVCLGIVGEYVGCIYQEVKRRPLYVVKEQWPKATANTSSLFESRKAMPERRAC